MNNKINKINILLILIIGILLIGEYQVITMLNKNDKEIKYVYKYIYTEEKQPQIKYKNLGEFTITAYCSCPKCCGKWALNRPKDENGNEKIYTASGTLAKAGRTIAVDPKVIPYGTKVIINGNEYIAEDCGGAIKGNRIDIYMTDHQKALHFGKKKMKVYISYVSK